MKETFENINKGDQSAITKKRLRVIMFMNFLHTLDLDYIYRYPVYSV